MSLLLTALITITAASELSTSPLQMVGTDFLFTEGPVWMPKIGWVFSDIPANTIYRLDRTPFRQPSNHSNGLTLDQEGRLLAAEHETRRVTRLESDGTVTVLADRFEGKRFNSPNDVAVRSDGTVFFTDPPYALLGGLTGPNGELGFSGVFAVLNTGEVRCVDKGCITPNGLVFSPDESTLYISDTEEDSVVALEVAPDTSASHRRTFEKVDKPDGMRVDVEGNVWTATETGVQVFSPQGALVHCIPAPHTVSNCAFGGPDGKTLLIMALHDVYSVQTSITGIMAGPKPGR